MVRTLPTCPFCGHSELHPVYYSIWNYVKAHTRTKRIPYRYCGSCENMFIEHNKEYIILSSSNYLYQIMNRGTQHDNN